MNILVTGTSGFIGGACLRAMIAAHHNVWGWSRKYHAAYGIDRSHYLEGDLLSSEIEKFVPNELDGIIHLAGVAGPGVALNHPAEALRVNTLGTERIFSLAHIKKIPVVFASSVYIYDGCTEFPWYENMEVRPRSPLGASKLGAEAVARVYAQCFNVASVALRFFTVYGPGSNDAQFIPSAFKKIHHAAAREEIKFGSHRSTRDFVYIDDAIRAITAAVAFIRLQQGFHIFNVANGQERTIEGCVWSMVKICGKQNAKIIFDAFPPRPDEPEGYSRHWASIEKSKKELGWYPKMEFEEGLKLTYKALSL